MFEHVDAYAGDPILSLNEDFQKDPRAHKINLSIGIYFDDAGRIPVLASVRRAEQQAFGLAHAVEHGDAAFVVEVDADRQVDLVRTRILLEILVQRQDRITGKRFNVLEHGAGLG